jgi:hypothetical protein
MYEPLNSDDRGCVDDPGTSLAYRVVGRCVLGLTVVVWLALAVASLFHR